MDLFSRVSHELPLAGCSWAYERVKRSKLYDITPVICSGCGSFIFGSLQASLTINSSWPRLVMLIWYLYGNHLNIYKILISYGILGCIQWSYH
jgi:hypothetical protein